jgi:Domain of unknown function (DUF6969)
MHAMGQDGVSLHNESEAAATLLACRQMLAARGGSVVGEAIGEGGEVIDWRHYPDGEVYDAVSHAQYFFHRHAGRGPLRHEPPEAGHFHLFLRGDGMPADSAPLLLPELAVANVAPPPRQSAPLKRGSRNEVAHLVAIAIDGRGEPVRLFTTNRWVTGETWYRADDVIRMLDRFCVHGDQPSALLNRWLAALIRLFARDIAELLHQRDKTIVERRWRWRTNVLEDPRLEITSSLAIDLDARLAAVERGDGEAASLPGIGRAPRLPPMAEGWGA